MPGDCRCGAVRLLPSVAAWGRCRRRLTGRKSRALDAQGSLARRGQEADVDGGSRQVGGKEPCEEGISGAVGVHHLLDGEGLDVPEHPVGRHRDRSGRAAGHHCQLGAGADAVGDEASRIREGVVVAEDEGGLVDELLVPR